MFRKIIETLIYIIFIIITSLYFSNFWYCIIFLLLHEYGHYITGRILGYTFKSATFLPFGITFGFKEDFIKPWDDILISISGPMVNFLFYILFLCINDSNKVLILFRDINLAIFLFNLIPAGFLDGGRIYKAVAVNIAGFNKAYYSANINGLILGVFIIVLSCFYELSYKTILLIGMGCFFILRSYLNIKQIPLNIIRDIINKQNYIKSRRKFRILYEAYAENTKILDIIKDFCFNKYYVISIMENGYLRYNINEVSLIKIYCTYGNINIGDCAKFINAQEGYNGKN